MERLSCCVSHERTDEIGEEVGGGGMRAAGGCLRQCADLKACEEVQGGIEGSGVRCDGFGGTGGIFFFERYARQASCGGVSFPDG